MISVQEALTKGSGEWRSFTCPSHDDRTPSARINVLTRKYVCMVCGSRGDVKNYEPPEHLVLEKIRSLSDATESPTEALLDLFDAGGPGDYWPSRFSREACEHFRLGYDSGKEKSVYSLRDPRGGLLGVVYRNFPGEKPKYRYPRGVSTSELLFGYEEVATSSSLVIVEGAPDVISLWEVGVPAVGAFGARLYPQQIQLINRLEPTKITVAFDQDQAGNIGGLQAVRDLRKAGLLAVRARWSGYNDPGDMPPAVRTDTFRENERKGLIPV